MSLFNDVYGDRDLSARAKMVCLYLHDRANSEGESWYAIGTIAADLGLSRSTVKRALSDLVRLGKVEKQPRLPGERRPDFQLVPIAKMRANEKSSLPTRGRLRRLIGLGAGSSWPTQKAPIEGALSSENENTGLIFMTIRVIIRKRDRSFLE